MRSSGNSFGFVLRGWEGYEKSIFVICLSFGVLTFNHFIVNAPNIIQLHPVVIGQALSQYIHVGVVGQIENPVLDSFVQTDFGENTINNI